MVRVGDASLVTEICNKLLNPKTRDAFAAEVEAENQLQRERFAASQKATDLIPLAEARKQRCAPEWKQEDIIAPQQPGLTIDDHIDLELLAEHFDYSPLFWTWELKGVFPKILEHKKYGEQAKVIYEDAQKLLKQIIQEKRFRARSVVGLFPANSVGDDVELYDPTSGEKRVTFHSLRQQKKKNTDKPYFALSDFVAPKDSGLKDACGAFVCCIEGVDTFAQEFKDAGDDYNSIMVKSLGDRFAEALAEYTHKRVRKELWGYAADETLDNESLIKEKYRGIRPAAGYPSQPDHTEKAIIWELLDAEKNTGATITSSFAMAPGSAVSGLYFAHPEAKYFQVGPIAKDQMEDYAKRSGKTLEEAERWLAPIRGY